MQQKTEDMLKEKEKLKADYAEMEKKLAYTTGKLDQLKEDMEQTRETRSMNGRLDQLKEDMKQARETLRILKQMLETQNIMINMLQQSVRLRFLFLHA